MKRAEALAAVRRQPGIWRGGELAAIRAEPTGMPEFDERLPGGGWPVGITELICQRPGVGEFGLLMPAIARLTRAGRRVALVAPPYLPYPHGLVNAGVKLDRLVLVDPRSPGDAHWAADQTLRSGSFAMVATWPRMSDRDLRRMQLAAEAGGCVGVVYRSRRAAASSAAALCVAVRRQADTLELEILRSRGGWPTRLRLTERYA